MKKRLDYLDGLRIFAILSIILLHVLLTFRYKYFPISKNYYTLYTILDSFTRMGVPIFFMLSGALMLSKKEEKNYITYFKKRIIKLVIAYYLFSIIYLLYDIKINHVSTTPFIAMEWITSSYVKHHLWYLPVIIMIYLLIPFMKKLVDNLSKKELETLIIVLFLFGNMTFFGSVVTEKLKHMLLKQFIFPDLMIYMNYLFMGYYLYKYDVKIKKYHILLSILSIILLPVFTIWLSEEAVIDTLLNSLSPLVVFPSITIFLLFKNHYPKIKCQAWINKCTYCVFYVYLIHILILDSTTRILKPIIIKTSGIKEIGLMLGIYIWVVVTSFILSMIYVSIKKRVKEHNKKGQKV